jgi:hypothetical protein
MKLAVYVLASLSAWRCGMPAASSSSDIRLNVSDVGARGSEAAPGGTPIDVQAPRASTEIPAIRACLK